VLSKTSISTLAEKCHCSKAYISQIRTGKRPASQRIIQYLLEKDADKRQLSADYLSLFLESRRASGVTSGTLTFYRNKLTKFLAVCDINRISRVGIQRFLNDIPANQHGLGNRHAHFRACKAFFNWLHQEHGLPDLMEGLHAPILSKPILPVLTKEQVYQLIDAAPCTRDRAIIALFVESGLRLSELASIKPQDIDWSKRTIKVMRKGRREGYCMFDNLTDKYLRAWLQEYTPSANIWGITKWGIVLAMRRLEKSTGLKCNCHVYRRSYASLLRKAGLDSLTIQQLGGWESIQMVQRYTRSVTFDDCAKLYRSPLALQEQAAKT
jgi:site-specific recombinase XerD